MFWYEYDTVGGGVVMCVLKGVVKIRKLLLLVPTLISLVCRRGDMVSFLVMTTVLLTVCVIFKEGLPTSGRVCKGRNFIVIKLT